MALNGSGFFVVDQGGLEQLTRAGELPTGSERQPDYNHRCRRHGICGCQWRGEYEHASDHVQIPVDATQAAQATENFGITANLDAATAGGRDVLLHDHDV